MTAPNELWTLSSTTSNTIAATTGWDTMSADGTPLQAMSADGSTALGVFLAFFSDSQGSLAWASPSGQFIDETPFTYFSAEDPLLSVFGAFSTPVAGSTTTQRTWFAETQFNLLGYRQATGSTALETTSIPIERESSFSEQQFEQMFQPVRVPGATVGTWDPGIYVDSTLTRGNRLAVNVWASGSTTVDQPLRYSLDVPVGCVEMTPVQVDAVNEPFALPYFCPTSSGGVELRMIVP